MRRLPQIHLDHNDHINLKSFYIDVSNNSISPWLKVVWNFQFEKLEKDKTKVSTETRVFLPIAPEVLGV